MARIVRLTESDLSRIVRKVIKESTDEMKSQITTTFSEFPTLARILMNLLLSNPAKIMDFIRVILKFLNPNNYEGASEEVYGFTASDHGSVLTDKAKEKMKTLLSPFNNITLSQINSLVDEIYKNPKMVKQKLESFMAFFK